jgi:hypothetical protein
VLVATLAFSILPIHAERADDIRARIAYVASSLSAGNPADAMSPFDKSFGNYDKLSSYFQMLTSSFEVHNELDVVDEQDTPTNTKLTVTWALTLTDLGTGSSKRRNEDVSVRLQLKDGKWKIVDFSPITLFDPLQK